MTEQLEQLRAQQYAELEALKKTHKEARLALRKKIYAETRKAKRQKSAQKMQEEATRRAFSRPSRPRTKPTTRKDFISSRNCFAVGTA